MISGYLRGMLILASILMSAYVMRKIRKSQMQIEDTVFWVSSSACLVVLSIFPGIAVNVAEIIGVTSPVNFVYLVIIFVLLLKVFLLSIKISQLEYKIRTLAQEEAIREYEVNKNQKTENSFPYEKRGNKR